MKHDELESIRGPEFGGRPALLDQVLDSFKLSSVSLGQPWNFSCSTTTTAISILPRPTPTSDSRTLQKVSNLLSLLRCAALMRFPVKSQDFHERTYIPVTTQNLDTVSKRFVFRWCAV